MISAICTPLHYAAQHNSTESAKLLLESGADIEAKDMSNLTPLHYAAQHNSTESAKLLLESGADIEANAESNATPLHYAAWNNSKESAQLLLERGADIEAQRYKQSHTSSQCCMDKQHRVCTTITSNVVQTLTAKDTKNLTPLHYAAQHNSTESAKLLLESGADIEAKDISNLTPLHYAAQ